MNIAFLSGAYKNSGDYLIEKRALELIQYVYPEAVISRFLRKEVSDSYAAINANDAAVIGGGPIFQTSLTGYMPLKEYTSEVRIPTMILGGGWYGNTGSSHEMQTYRFDQQTKAFYYDLYASGYGFSCRDLHTVNILKNNGFQNVLMTGCPAWYDIRYVEKTDFRGRKQNIRSIMVSDPARICNLKSAMQLIEYLKVRFPEADLTFVFHRGIKSDSYTSDKSAAELQKYAHALKNSGVQIRDISYGAEGFSLYDDCDLHIGFRVHAHIYNLSIRNRSILIEEDGRGAGVNETLGLPSVRVYDDTINIHYNPLLQRVNRRFGRKKNHSMITELDTYLEMLQMTEFEYIANAFRIQKRYFHYMVDYLKQLER